MCGLAGFFNRDGTSAMETVVQLMVAKIAHRGPDDSGIWTGGGAGLGSCRLSVIDPGPQAHQPFVVSDGSGVLVYNGEVYNFRELRRELEALGRTFYSASDTEVVAQALCEWGPEKAVARFNGMFAFAWYETQTHTLWLARDRVGIKPLYVAHTGKVLAFASEAKALFEHPEIPCRADLHALTTQVLFSRLTGTWTPFELVRSLQPGTLLKVDAEGETPIVWFDLERDLDVGRIVQRNDVEGLGLDVEMERLLRESVRAHLVSDAPLAMMCSGGLDSSLLTAIAALETKGLSAYVADVACTPVKEVEKARIVCRHTGVELRPVPYSREDFLRDWPVCIYHNDQPHYFAQNMPTRAICRAAHRDGIKVLLGGEGADELFGGYSWQATAFRHGQRLQRSQRLFRFLPGLHRVARKLGRCVEEGDPRQLTDAPFGLRSDLLRTVTSGPRAWALDGGQRQMRRQAFFQKLGPLRDSGEQAFLTQSLEDFSTHLQTSLCSIDKMAMAHSVEMRVPFLDTRVMDFGLHAPMSAKYHRGEGKRVVKQVGRRMLPTGIVDAVKIGFGIDGRMWKGSGWILRGGVVAELFKWPAGSAERIQQQIEHDDRAVFHLVSVELWARIFLRRENPEQLGELLLSRAADSRSTT